MMEREAPPEIEAPEIQAPGSAFRWLVGSVFAVAILYLGREILIPLAVASLLTVILSPVASLLEQYIGRALGAFSVLVMTIAVLGGGIYFFAIEAGQVATEVSTYSEQIGKKISDLEKGASPVVLQVEEFIDDVNREISRFLPGREQQGNQPPAIQQLSAAPSIGEWLRPAVPFFLVLAVTVFAQDITTWINGTGGKPALAVIDFRGSGSQPFMDAFNSTLFNDLQGRTQQIKRGRQTNAL